MTDQHDLMPIDWDDLWGDLVVSVLGVNQYKLELTYASLPSLRAAGICSPDNLARWVPEEIIERLKVAGLDRGPFMTTLFAKRLRALGVAAEKIGFSAFGAKLANKNRAEISELLLPINGIGPRVLNNFFLLRQI